ncbi:hypothetical protein [Paraburkholderia xenovorans]
MSDLKHTPGPWKFEGHFLRPVEPDPQRHAVHTIMEAETFGWGFCGSDHAKTRVEDDANILLIEACPDLLDAALAAEAVLAKGRWVEGSTDPEAVAFYKLRAAIAKALGA